MLCCKFLSDGKLVAWFGACFQAFTMNTVLFLIQYSLSLSSELFFKTQTGPNDTTENSAKHF